MTRLSQGNWYAPGLLVILVIAGCGPGNGLNLGRVQGKVTYKGQPVKYGTVSFVPDAKKGTDGPIATGNITQDGSYILSTSEAGDGAIVGHHRVSVVGLDPSPVAKTDEKPQPNPEESPLEVMKARGKGLMDAQRGIVKKAAAKLQEDTFTDRGGRVFRYVVPKKFGLAEESGLETEVTRGSNTINIDIAEDGTARVAK
jgi:hypothetical protein